MPHDTPTIPSMQDLIRQALTHAAVDADGLVLTDSSRSKVAVQIHPPGDAVPVGLSLLDDLVQAGTAMHALLSCIGGGKDADPIIQQVYDDASAASSAWDDALLQLGLSIQSTFGTPPTTDH